MGRVGMGWCAAALMLFAPCCAERDMRVESSIPFPDPPLPTSFRGRFVVDAEGAASSQVRDELIKALETQKPGLLRCLQSEKGEPFEVWSVARVRGGALTQLKTAVEASPSALQCIADSLRQVHLTTTETMAVSLLLQAEPAPSNCAAHACIDLPGDVEVASSAPVATSPAPVIRTSAIDLHQAPAHANVVPEGVRKLASAPTATLTAGGVALPSVEGSQLSTFLETKGWRAMAVEGEHRGDPFTVFAIKKGEGAASVTWRAAKEPSQEPHHRSSGGFELWASGASAERLLDDLIDR